VMGSPDATVSFTGNSYQPFWLKRGLVCRQKAQHRRKALKEHSPGTATPRLSIGPEFYEAI
jgi:hypothetical protein